LLTYVPLWIGKCSPAGTCTPGPWSVTTLFLRSLEVSL